MAQFRFVFWLVEWLLIQTSFVFEWDSGNDTKSLEKYRVTTREAEEVFESPEDLRALGEQVKPFTSEPRFGVLGVTKTGRKLFVCFTLRGTGIRVISAREMNQKERNLYGELCEE